MPTPAAPSAVESAAAELLASVTAYAAAARELVRLRNDAGATLPGFEAAWSAERAAYQRRLAAMDAYVAAASAHPEPAK